MRIGIINGSSQKDKNAIITSQLELALAKIEGDFEIINFGVYADEEYELSYIEVALGISMLLSSQAVDFIISGCSSGTGMMLACNALPNVICGYTPTATDAYLFGRINAGNAISLPLGLNYGWAAELNLAYIFEQLFSEPFGIGYPKADAERKKHDSKLLKQIKGYSQKTIVEVIAQTDPILIKKIMSRPFFSQYLLANSKDAELNAFLQTL